MLILALLLFSALTIASPAQTLLNTSFEDAETEALNPFGDLAAHWGRWGNWINRESVWEPTRNGKCLLGYHHWKIEEITSSGVFQDVPNTPAGRSATFSVYAWKDKDTDAESVELRIEKINGSGEVASRVFAIGDIPLAGWGKLTVTGTNPEAGLRVLITVKPKPSGERHGALKFDDASLVFEP